MAITAPGGKVRAGTSVTATVTIRVTQAKAPNTKLRLTPDGRPKPGVNKCVVKACDLKDLTDRAVIDATLAIPKDIKSGSVTLKATVTADGAQTKTASIEIPVTGDLDTKPPSPSPSPSDGGGNSGGSGGSSGSSGRSGSSGSNNTSYTPPATNGSLNAAGSGGQPPQVALPPITQAPAPSVAPGQSSVHALIGPASTLRSNSRATQQLTFERIASTQAAWLAALLVAFSLLLTQIRLGRRPDVPGHGKGVHRRPRRGVFGS